jgi:Rrf2 family protein
MSQLINISEAASLGFHGLALIAEADPERINVKTAAKRLNASEAHLAKVFQALNRAGIIRSRKGPGGGFVLNADPADISFLLIYEILEGPVFLDSCPLNHQSCSFGSCLFDGKLNALNQGIVDVFSSISLDQFKKGSVSLKENRP